MSSFEQLRRRASLYLAVPLWISLIACSLGGRQAAARPKAVAGNFSVTEPRVTADTAKAAARICADRGFSYVAQIDAHHYYCLRVNLLDEPEAVPVDVALAR